MKISIAHLHTLGKLYNIVFLNVNKIIIFPLLLFIFLFISCKTNIFDSTQYEVNTVSDTSSVMVVSPNQGGILSLPSGNGWLEIPPGALEQTTTITILNKDHGNPNSIFLSLEPNGLTFKKPVRLTVSYNPEDDGSPPLISLIHISDLNDIVDVGHEQHKWAPLENIVLDDQANTISGEIQHFSDIEIDKDNRLAYLILDLPGKYLRPGDGLFALSGTLTSDLKGDWWPGHTGMVRSVDRDLNKLTVIESTLAGESNGYTSGVQFNSFLNFKREGHVYMGARRPKGTIMSDGERKTAIEFGDSQIGKFYNAIGTDFPFLPGWSCTGLLEACWKKANHGTQGITDFIPMPSEMFEASLPITEITVQVGEEVKIPVYPVVAELDLGFLNVSQDHYKVGAYVSEVVSVNGQPDKAEWEKDFTHPYRAQTLTWKPEPKDAGESYTINFQVSGSRSWGLFTYNFNITQKLIVHVQGAHKIFEVYPVSFGSSGNWIIHLFSIPHGARVSEESQDHLIDVETGNFPANPIFENQILDKYYEGWAETRPNYYGSWKHLQRLDNAYNDPPTGTRSWIYWIDYEVILYNGLN